MPGDAEFGSGLRRTSSRRHKKRRNRRPAEYDDWDEKDKEYYEDVTLALRQWKVAQMQCQLQRFRIGFWKYFKFKISKHPLYAAEMKDYKASLEAFKAIKKNKTLDFDY
ncbi:unnamed protein product [Thelazia callipaeda]|uniref:XRN2-binding (XTBD) domain-containing protein n=1 Tax=Thelazia callipaeda TaxID=103827 RepID=A0A0N5CUU5_THECL|nr:unnamed protein product [Thelazia callipaeda]